MRCRRPRARAFSRRETSPPGPAASIRGPHDSATRCSRTIATSIPATASCASRPPSAPVRSWPTPASTARCSRPGRRASSRRSSASSSPAARTSARAATRSACSASPRSRGSRSKDGRVATSWASGARDRCGCSSSVRRRSTCFNSRPAPRGRSKRARPAASGSRSPTTTASAATPSWAPSRFSPLPTWSRIRSQRAPFMSAPRSWASRE